MRKITLALLFCAYSFPTLALDIPYQSARDSNIQYSQYRDDDVVHITAVTGMVTQLIVDKSEKLVHVETGFPDGWRVEKRDNNLFIWPQSAKGIESYIDYEGKEVSKEISIQPNPKEWRTNLMVVTDKRNYAFILTLGTGTRGMRANTYRLTFLYPEEKARQEAQAKAAQVEKLKREQEIRPKNLNYSMQVGKFSRSIAPKAVYDDGRFTYLTFASNAEIPAIFMVADDGKETLINSHINPVAPDTVVIQRIAKTFVLRLDDAVVGVHNMGFGALHVDNQKATTLEAVERVVKEVK
ncbi:channel protein VirB9 [Vibrio ichthyoenteri ATCC 700023]|uniref:Channel protein VirB9 n=1 Tax=Vibrio ichthyoenteri ATCC 700023 TaxID=870968 RepID=F9S7T8_9VIBR|nr:P-type conjugative transfer protein VirB9 [Vibrio ichthyoenteri]EGU30988.1 channel protein VirB9 [Vibrio ichthyoenteri ATCC 700023]